MELWHCIKEEEGLAFQEAGAQENTGEERRREKEEGAPLCRPTSPETSHRSHHLPRTVQLHSRRPKSPARPATEDNFIFFFYSAVFSARFRRVFQPFKEVLGLSVTSTSDPSTTAIYQAQPIPPGSHAVAGKEPTTACRRKRRRRVAHFKAIFRPPQTTSGQSPTSNLLPTSIRRDPAQAPAPSTLSVAGKSQTKSGDTPLRRCCYSTFPADLRHPRPPDRRDSTPLAECNISGWSSEPATAVVAVAGALQPSALHPCNTGHTDPFGLVQVRLR